MSGKNGDATDRREDIPLPRPGGLAAFQVVVITLVPAEDRPVTTS